MTNASKVAWTPSPRDKAHTEAFWYFRRVADTPESRALLNKTTDCIEDTGEVSETISYEWDALAARQAGYAEAAE